MDVESCDVLIVGGGPAGSTCARQLIAAGVDACVMDKSEFPRDKVCAGWITPQIVRSLELDLDDYRRARNLQSIDSFALGTMSAASTVVSYEQAVSYAMRRCEFDDYLLQRCGARLRLGESPRSLERSADGWLVNGVLSTRMIVGAGGHFCPIARLLGAEIGRSEAAIVAQETELALSPRQAAECSVRGNRPELYFCDDLRGYGWCVRKGDVINVGLGREAGHALVHQVQDLWAWLRRQGKIPADLVPRFKGHAYLLYSRSERPLVDDRALLIGDAAGLAYAQSGEGIRPAVESALLAAEAIVAARGDYSRERLKSYVRRIEARFGRRDESRSAFTILPQGLRQSIGRWALSNRQFARHVVLDQWFLHRRQSPLPALQCRFDDPPAMRAESASG